MTPLYVKGPAYYTFHNLMFLRDLGLMMFLKSFTGLARVVALSRRDSDSCKAMYAHIKSLRGSPNCTAHSQVAAHLRTVQLAQGSFCLFYKIAVSRGYHMSLYK